MTGNHGKFGSWFKQNFNITNQDNVDLGDIVLVNVTMTPSDGGSPITYSTPTKFTVSSNKDGTVFRLQDSGYSDPNTGMAEFPHATASKKAGRTYVLAKDQYEKLRAFPAMPAAPEAPMG